MSPDAPAPESHDDADLPGGERLQKVMAAAGVASRRVSEDLIAAGRVLVNGRIVTEPGRRIDPETDEVVVDGTVVQLDATRRYVMLNKPVGIVSSLSDEHGRPDLRQFTAEYDERLFNVGRLDVETSGLLLLTNDGRIAHVLAHPSFGVTKTYVAKVRGQVTREVLAQLSAGVELDDGPIAADKARLVGGGAGLSQSGDSSLVEITLHSGRNRIVRRMMEAVGHPVVDLVRRQFGPLHLGTLKVGHMRALTRDELGAILTLARDPQDAQRPADADDRTGVAEADVVDVEVDAEKDYYDEDDPEFDPDTDARDERRRGRAPAGGPGRSGGSGPRAGGAPLTRRAEVRREQAGRRDGGRDESGRPPRGRDERGGYQGRDDRGGAPRSGGYQGRDDRGGAPRSGGYQGRDDRGGYQGRDDRGLRRDDDRRPPRDDRGAAPRTGGYQGRDDRGGAPRSGGYQGRDDRGGAPRTGGYQGRDDRGPRRDDDRRPPRDDRGGAPRSGGYQGRDDRGGAPRSGGYQGRDDRGGASRSGGYQGRDDRGGAPRTGGYQGRDDRGPRRDDDRRPPRDDRGAAPRSGYQGRDDRGAAPRGGGYQGRDDRGPRRDDDRGPRRDDDRGGPRGGGRAPRGGDRP